MESKQLRQHGEAIEREPEPAPTPPGEHDRYRLRAALLARPEP
jgi:hypothetical protein